MRRCPMRHSTTLLTIKSPYTNLSALAVPACCRRHVNGLHFTHMSAKRAHEYFFRWKRAFSILSTMHILRREAKASSDPEAFLHETPAESAMAGLPSGKTDDAITMRTKSG